ncbi:hypothetical protein BDA99DRAFT_523408 [Phascolomyces articulosus]|uniref:Uncharacterized protein n=1 Tax=Phascolomyces articulosus TaxID=60185 RepID=A0AAD5P990_9FUNG|nr:hypothetical protein BDA99DRAFT_523408 [Phascolomyces articulosus]
MSNYTVLSVHIMHNDNQQQNSGGNNQQLPTPPPERQLEQSSGFNHHSEYCVCRGSGVGCECGRFCHCAEVKKTTCHCGQGCYNSWDRCMLG